MQFGVQNWAAHTRGLFSPPLTRGALAPRAGSRRMPVGCSRRHVPQASVQKRTLEFLSDHAIVQWAKRRGDRFRRIQPRMRWIHAEYSPRERLSTKPLGRRGHLLALSYPVFGRERNMAKQVSHYVTRPGRSLGDPSVTFPVAADLTTVPGIPTREKDVAFFSREYPLENMGVEESASAAWAREIRRGHSTEAQELYEKHDLAMEPIVEWIKESADLQPTGTPTGKDVTEKIRQKARELGYGQVGFTRFDRHYVYQSRKSMLRPGLPNAICLALEQEYIPTQTIPSLDAEAVHGGTYELQGPLTMELTDYIRSLGYRAQVSGPSLHYGPMIPMFVAAGLGQLGANGQLLSPHFGSRARLAIITTDAPVTYDQPVDYGIH